MAIIALVVAVFIVMCIEAVSATIVGWVFFDLDIGEAWSMVWDHPIALCVIAILTLLFKD